MELVRQARKVRTANTQKAAPTPGAGKVDISFQVLKFSLDAETDERIVTGAVLVPDKVDAHGDLLPREVIRKAALDFGFRLNRAPDDSDLDDAVAGVQHTDFEKTETIRIVENYLAPVDFELNGVLVLEGSWIVSMKVLDDDVWADVKAGKITGFSMGGAATVERTALGMQVAQAASESEVPYVALASQIVQQARAIHAAQEAATAA